MISGWGRDGRSEESLTFSTKDSRQFKRVSVVHEMCLEKGLEYGGTMYVNQTTIDTLLKRFDVTDFSDIPAAVSAGQGPVKEEDKVMERPYRHAVGGLMWVAGATRPGIKTCGHGSLVKSYRRST